MINTSSEYKAVICGQDRRFYGEANIILTNGITISFNGDKIKALKIEDASSQSGKFTLGSAIVNELILSLNNMDDAYSDYDFTGAIIRPSVGLKLSSTIETLQKGVFTADDPKVRSSIITLTALDNMHKFDKPFKDVVQIFPCTNYTLLSAVCMHCGVDLATHSFLNGDYVIQSRPVDDAINCREIISWIATMAGCFARCNTSGELDMKWYDMSVLDADSIDGGYFDSSNPYSSGDNVDGGSLSDYSSGDNIDGGLFTDTDKYHNFYSITNNNISTDDVVITGIKVADSSETPNTVLFGQEGYVISIEGNKLIQSQSDAQAIANSVGAKLVGMRFRPLSITTRSDPSVEAGDVAYVSVRKGISYQTVITNVSYSIYQSMRITCDADSPARNSATRYSEAAKAVVEARKNTELQLSTYDLAVQRMNRLAANTMGYYYTEVKQEDGAIIAYRHDKPNLEDSTIIYKEGIDGFWLSTDGGQTYSYGRDSQGNAVLNILDAIGIRLEWLKAGKLYSKDGSTLIDMDYGVANSDNISFVDNVADGYPLRMPFNIDDAVSKITSLKLKYTIDKFRTYSTTTESAGHTYTSTASSSRGTGEYTSSTSSMDITTGGGTDEVGHTHSVYIPGHDHVYYLHIHSHDFEIPSHAHDLNYGIMENVSIDNNAAVFVDGTQRATISEAQGIIDLTAFVTTVGWHNIEIRSTTLKRVSAQINIKSYIKS